MQKQGEKLRGCRHDKYRLLGKAFTRWIFLIAGAATLLLTAAGSWFDVPASHPAAAAHALLKVQPGAFHTPAVPAALREYLDSPAGFFLMLFTIGFQVTVLPILTGILKRGFYRTRFQEYTNLTDRLVGILRNGFHRLEHILPAEVIIAHFNALFFGSVLGFNAFLSSDFLMGMFTPFVTCFSIAIFLPFAGFPIFGLYIENLVITRNMGFGQASNHVLEELKNKPAAIMFLGPRRTIALALAPFAAALLQIPLVMLQSLWNSICRAAENGTLQGPIPWYLTMLVSLLFSASYLLLQLALNLFMTHQMFSRVPSRTGNDFAAPQEGKQDTVQPEVQAGGELSAAEYSAGYTLAAETFQKEDF